MHQSGQLREQSMHTVQFSSLRAMTPRARGAGDSDSCGYWTVTAPLVGAGMSVRIPRFGNSVWSRIRIVILRPVKSPGTFGLASFGI
jgi:hypothetical protein